MRKLIETRDQRDEKNCCSVIALALALDLSFDEANMELQKLGRRPRSGVSARTLGIAISNNGFHFSILKPKAATIGSLRKKYPFSDSNVVFNFTRDHVFISKNGLFYEPDFKPRRRIKLHFVLENASQMEFGFMNEIDRKMIWNG